MVKNGVIFVVDTDTFEVLFEHNLAFRRQHIHCDSSNQWRDRIMFCILEFSIDNWNLLSGGKW